MLGSGFKRGIEDSIRAINISDGICGAEVELILVDTQFDPERNISAYQEHRQNTSPLVSITTNSTSASILLASNVNEDNITNLAYRVDGSTIYNPRGGYTVGAVPIHSDQFAGFLQFLVENWEEIKPEDSGDEIVVGVTGWDNAFGESATTPESLAYAENLDIQVLELELHTISPEVDMVVPIKSLVSQGANVIYYQGLGFTTSEFIKTLHDLDLWDDLIIGGVNWSMDANTLDFLGEGNEILLSGYYSVFPYKWWNDSNEPGVQQAIAAFDAGGYPATGRGVDYLISYATTFAWKTILEHAIDMVGYENLNGEAFFSAFQDLGTVSALGIFEFDVRGDTRAPQRAQIRQAQMVDERIEFIVVKDFFELPDTKPSVE
jgi:branched-chain amino acid transport system substrate-binding protein